jgi:hypothetical protein
MTIPRTDIENLIKTIDQEIRDNEQGIWDKKVMDRLVNIVRVFIRGEKSSVQEFADTIKYNPKEIIEWCKREQREYQSLIDILENHDKKRS